MSISQATDQLHDVYHITTRESPKREPCSGIVTVAFSEKNKPHFVCLMPTPTKVAVLMVKRRLGEVRGGGHWRILKICAQIGIAASAARGQSRRRRDECDTAWRRARQNIWVQVVFLCSKVVRVPRAPAVIPKSRSRQNAKNRSEKRQGMESCYYVVLVDVYTCVWCLLDV